HGRLYHWFERAFEALQNFYERGLRWALAHRRTMLLATLATVGLSGALVFIVPPGFFPQQDTGILQGTTEAAQDVSFPTMMRLQNQVNAILKQDPDIDHYLAFIGAGGTGTSNTGSVFISLKSLPPRKLNSDEILGRLRGKLAQVVGINTYLQSR